MRRIFLFGALACLAGSASSVRAAEWVTTWAAAPMPPVAAGPMPATPSFQNQTIRQVVRISAGGQRLRIRFTNEYGTKPLKIGSARVALNQSNGEAAEMHQVTFGGQHAAILPAGAPLLSDPLDIAAPPLSSVTISLYLPEDTGPCTCHSPSLQTAYVSLAGDFTAENFTVGQKIQMRAFLSAVDVEVRAGNAKAIAILGDSTTDGVGSTGDANRRWPDLLSERLVARGRARGIANLGIGGNQVLADGSGQSALARFDRDVLSVSAVTHLIVFQGINDLGFSLGPADNKMVIAMRNMAPANKLTSESLIEGYRQIIARAHAKKLKVIGATITPYAGAQYFSEEGESIRQAVNKWIRNSKEFDAVLDFDAVLRDPENSSRIAEGLHAVDRLHGNDAGYAALAKSIDLKLFE